MKNFSQPRILLLYARYIDSVSYYDDWQDAFTESGMFTITALNLCDLGNYNRIRKTLSEYDAIVILHSANANGPHYLEPYKWLLQKRKCKLFSFVGNELNYPNPGAGMRHKLKFFREIEPNIIASQLTEESALKLYEGLHGVSVQSIPHALNPKVFYSTVPNGQRPTDIGQRSAKYYPLIGDNERELIINYFLHNHTGLTIDINTDNEQRLNRQGWADFLNRCKGTIATEAGTYYLEQDDDTVLKIDQYIRQKLGIKEPLPDSSGKWGTLIHRWVPYHLRQKVKTFLPTLKPSADDDQDVHFSESIYYILDFSELFVTFFKNYKTPLNGKCISSRHFEAIGTQTCQIMFPGYFNGILKADEHYIPVKRDFSDINEAMAKFRDTEYRTRMVIRTAEYIRDNHTYLHRIKKIYDILSEKR